MHARAWANEHELLAAGVELLHGILGELRRGVPVVTVKRQGRPVEPYRVPRPAWVGTTVAGESEEITVSPRELITMLKG